ncbi:hypothetical protein BIW11_01564 [Tropilaelaps mercedesae]|uniref:DUF5666 domain-containing protein n=1 Tax=Tropilaelaps mercedesae TaxID=418985 RepID=A0A1V9XC30_9ACAR|nr:hypothetical protein BIW11_01564 [Tropilaelaps mercedesae]
MKTFVVVATIVTVASAGFLGGGGGDGHGGGHGGDFGGGHGGGSSVDEDGAALSAVGLARLLGGGASHGHLASGGGGASYTISGPTQEIKSSSSRKVPQVAAEAAMEVGSRVTVQVVGSRAPALEDGRSDPWRLSGIFL